MTPTSALACLGAISLFVVATRAILACLIRIADDRRARHARDHLVGRMYWSPDLVFADTPFHPAADATGVITQRLPRGWVPLGRVIDVSTPSRLPGMIVAALLVALGFTASAYASPPPSTAPATASAYAEPCGSERAAVKLGTDAEASKVDPSVTDTTIADLIALPRPRSTARRAPAELKTWQIHATITAYKAEADGDYHVVVSDSDGHRMIVEIPSPGCAAGGVWTAQVAEARKAFDTLVGAHRPAAKLRRVAIEATITGVGFYDFIHGQTGVARNGIELHPVLSIESGGGS